MTIEQMLRELVEAGTALRSTAIVDDDFPAMVHRFDSLLEAARRILQSVDSPRGYFQDQHA
jgi:hypothetical protein